MMSNNREKLLGAIGVSLVLIMVMMLGKKLRKRVNKREVG